MPVVRLRRLGYAVCLAASLGCSAIDRKVPPVYDIRGSRVLIVPFRSGNYWHYESKDGNRLGQSIEGAMQTDCGGLQTIRNRPLQEEIRRDLSDEIPWLEYARRAEVDYLIVGEIESLSLEEPSMIGMFQGRIRVRYEVWDVRGGKRGYTRALEVRFPENPEAGEVYISFEQSREEITVALMAAAGRKIAGHLCGYEQSGLPQ